MAAGTKYVKDLNQDARSVKTPAIYDATLDEWLMLSANVVKTEGGVFIYQKGTDDGKAKVSAELTGSSIDRRGLAANKPAANAVIEGTTYWSVDTDPNGDVVEVSDGTSWTVMV